MKKSYTVILTTPNKSPLNISKRSNILSKLLFLVVTL
jgi:hypothetical protein